MKIRNSATSVVQAFFRFHSEQIITLWSKKAASKLCAACVKRGRSYRTVRHCKPQTRPYLPDSDKKLLLEEEYFDQIDTAMLDLHAAPEDLARSRFWARDTRCGADNASVKCWRNV